MDIAYLIYFVSEGSPQAEDQVILSQAVRENPILITNDKDFGELVFRSGQIHSGILLLRLQDERSANRLRVIQIILKKYAHLLEGHFSVASDADIRIRPLKQ